MIGLKSIFFAAIFWVAEAANNLNPEVLPSGAAVATAHPLATQAALSVLQEGGNAFDAAIAASAVLSVVAPYHSGLGGGGLWILYSAKNKQYLCIDSREFAPGKSKSNMFLDKHGRVIPDASLVGPKSAAIPGEPAALDYLAKHFAVLPLSKTLKPAIRLAHDGFPVDSQFWRLSSNLLTRQHLLKFAATKRIFLTESGGAYPIASLLKQPDLANTLSRLARYGAQDFYQGETAKELVRAVQEAGGIWTLGDLARYKVIIRSPLFALHRDYRIYTAPLPSAGGIALLTILKILEPLQGTSVNVQQYSLDTVHYLVEAMRLTFWQRDRYLGDPDFVPVNLDAMLSEKHISYLRSFIKADKATPSNELQKINDSNSSARGKHTTHIAIMDSQGNRVSATLTINYWFGSAFVAGKTGVLLNDQMDDFAIAPGVPNVFGIVGSEKNKIEPYKRPLSNMAPTIIENAHRVGILGTPGGSRIPTMVLLGALGFMQGFDAMSIASLHRFHHQYLPDWIEFEPGTLSPAVIAGLKKMGYQLRALPNYYGDMQAITWDKETQQLTASSDPRHIGLAEVIPVQRNEGYGVGR